MKIDKNIFQTIFVRFGVAAMNMIIVFITLNTLGAKGRGEISLFTTDLALIAMFTNILCSSTISYHAPKTNLKLILKLGVVWALSTCLLISVILNIIHDEYLQKHLFFISFLQSLLTIHQMILIGKQNIKQYNIIFVIEPFIKLFVLLVGFFILHSKTLKVFLFSIYLSLFISIIISIFFTVKYYMKDKRSIHIKPQQIFKYGIGTETSSFIQFLNYRLLFYVIFYQLGATSLGWFSVAVSVTESAWIISRSITVNQYSKILNTSNQKLQQFITNKSAKLSFLLTLPACLFLCLLPNDILKLVIKNDVVQIHEIIIYLCPGILLISVSNVWGHYFSGIGKFKINNLKSLIGFIFMIASAFLFIPKYQITGAVYATVIGYTASSLTLLLYYIKEKK